MVVQRRFAEHCIIWIKTSQSPCQCRLAEQVDAKLTLDLRLAQRRRVGSNQNQLRLPLSQGLERRLVAERDFARLDDEVQALVQRSLLFLVDWVPRAMLTIRGAEKMLRCCLWENPARGKILLEEHRSH